MPESGIGALTSPCFVSQRERQINLTPAFLRYPEVIIDLHNLPANLPAPANDGACDHLAGLALPSIALCATDGTKVDLSQIPGRSVVFLYPRTGVPGQPSLVADWDDIPGAPGCTPQTCGYRDLSASFQELDYRVFGLSTQTTEYQAEMVERLGVPFPVLSDSVAAPYSRPAPADLPSSR